MPNRTLILATTLAAAAFSVTTVHAAEASYALSVPSDAIQVDNHLTNDNIRQAVALWRDNPQAAEQIWGAPMSSWDTQYVTNLDNLFDCAPATTTFISKRTQTKRSSSNNRLFNEPLNGWNTARVTSMEYTFAGCTEFNQHLRGWDTAEVTSMKGMFQGASSFNKTLTRWQTTEVTDMSSMFQGATSFDGNLEGWDTSRVVTMERMFNGATFFTGSSLSGWNTEQVTNLQFMFSGATAFQEDIASWNTGSVQSMTGMFSYAAQFDQDLSDWNLESVTSMDRMFYRATAFSAELCWETLGPAVSGMDLFCGSSGMFDYSDDCSNQENWPIGYEDNDDECPEVWEEIEEDERAREGDGLEGQPNGVEDQPVSEILDLQKYGGSTEGVGRGGSGAVGAMNPSSEAAGRDHPEATAKLREEEKDQTNDRNDGIVVNVQVIPTDPEEGDESGGEFTADALEEESSATILRTWMVLIGSVGPILCLI